MMETMTPKEFAAKMREIDEKNDTESSHWKQDELMCEILASLGYKEGVDIFNSTEKWYT